MNQKTKNFVEIGRVAVINAGPLKGRFCVILNIVDHRRVLIDAPRVKGSNDQTDLKRQTYPTRHLRLTRFKINLRHDENHDVVAKMWTDAKLTEKVNNTRYVRRQLKQQRVSIQFECLFSSVSVQLKLCDDT